MTVIIYIICTLESIINAYFDAKLIKRDKLPDHEKNAGIYIGFVFVCCAFTNFWQAIPLLCLRALVFDQALNLFRRKPITYQSKVTGSVIDKMENALFGKYAWHVSNSIYLLGFIISVWLI